MKSLFANTYFRLISVLILGILLGYLIFGSAGTHSHEHSAGADTESGGEVWTCSMHPNVRDDQPGLCPICAMDLIPASEMNGDGDDMYTLVMSESAIRLANIQTVAAKREKPSKTLHLPGRVEIDERNITRVSAHFPGRITDLKVNFTGAEIRKGQVLARVYSPDLVTAQRELLEARARADQNPALLRAARQKLRQWELSDAQIREIEQSGRVERNVAILAPADGIVLGLNVAREQYVNQGTVLFEMADFSNLWAVFDAYEEDMPWLSTGSKIHFHDRSRPSVKHQADISFVEPILQSDSRTVRIRADISGQENLRPGMILRGELKSELQEEFVMVPASSVLWTGPRSLVYVRHEENDVVLFESREVSLGNRAGDFFIIEDGLSEGENVVFHGAFVIDSEMQLMDRFSMMNRQAGPRPVPYGFDPFAVDRYDDVPEEFKSQLREVVTAYITGKDYLVESSRESAQTAFGEMKSNMERIGEHGLSGSGHSAWMQAYRDMNGHLNPMLETDDIEEMRTQFRFLSEILIRAVRQFGIDGVVYQQYCPMAFDDEGAYWISDEEQIMNPYLPESMLMCGEVIEALE